MNRKFTPTGQWSLGQVKEMLLTLEIDNQPIDIRWRDYAVLDHARFALTETLIPRRPGRVLEVGSYPHLITSLLLEHQRESMQFMAMDVPPVRQVPRYDVASRMISWISPETEQRREAIFPVIYCNIEAPLSLNDIPPFSDPQYQFDVIVFCEVLEHLTLDPAMAIFNLNQLLKDDGTLIISTPNALALERLLFPLERINLADKYWGDDPYQRHNREYSFEEVNDLLAWNGFVPRETFTANTRSDGPVLQRLLSKHSYMQPFVRTFRPLLGAISYGIWKKSVQSVQPVRPSWLYAGRDGITEVGYYVATTTR